MSKSLDQQLILDYYQRMTDSEVTRIATQDWASLTHEAQEVLKNEIVRRKIDIDLSAIAESQQEWDIQEGSPGGFYWGKWQSGTFEISITRKKSDEPENMVATLAHEIAHIKLLGESRMSTNDERLTDLTTIFFGLGIFNANAAFQTFNDANSYSWSQSGYLTQMEWGYALALFAYLPQELNPKWADHLSKNVKGDFIRGKNFISTYEDLIFQEG